LIAPRDLFHRLHIMAKSTELDLELQHVTPRIWRRIRVPADITLADLHHVIQAVMAWRDHHLHLFEIAGRDYGIPPEEDWEREQWDGIDDSTIGLSKALLDGSGAFEYCYDFGDEWRLAVSRIGETITPGPSRVECVGGERAAPPEDSGGPHAYQELVNALAERGKKGLTPDQREWLPKGFDPARFDLDETNARLRSIFDDREEEPDPPQFADADEALIADVSLLALFLGSWEESSGLRMAWKSLS
jgi:hypothetical protein